MKDKCVTPLLVVYGRGCPWPWAAPRPNPPMHGYRMRPWWAPLRTAGRYNEAIRVAVRNAAGVYAIREVGAVRPLYVGMSEAGDGGRYPERFWKTILRHLQPGTGKFRYARSRDGQPTEWLYAGSHNLEIAVWITPPGEAYKHETQTIGKLEPLHVKPGRMTEEAPF